MPYFGNPSRDRGGGDSGGWGLKDHLGVRRGIYRKGGGHKVLLLEGVNLGVGEQALGFVRTYPGVQEDFC